MKIIITTIIRITKKVIKVDAKESNLAENNENKIDNKVNQKVGK
jgi:hypothetical protein